MKHLLKPLALSLVLCATLPACVPLIVTGIGSGVSSTLDRRTYGEQFKDQEIELKVMRAINRKLDDKVNISTTAFNGRVLLSGQALTASHKAEAAKLAREAQNVTEVFDEVTIGWPATFATGTNDRLITSSVKGRLFDPDVKGVSGHHIKVVTESGTVFLMGKLGASEAKTAVEVTRTTRGVTKVVDLFEIISDEEVKRYNKAQEPAPVSSQR